MADATASRGGMGSALTVLASTLGVVTISVDGTTAAMKANTSAIEANIAATVAKTAADDKLKADQQEISDRTMMHTRALGDNTTGMIQNAAQAAEWGASLGSSQANLSKITAQAMIDTSGLSDKLKDAATAALNASDAFDNLASSFGEVSGQADHAADGLQAVAWEMVHATQPTFTLDAAQNALIESLAKVSDQYGQTSLWVGHLLAQFKDGSVTIDDFRKQLATMLTGMNQLPAAFGFTAVEMNKLLTIIDQFKNTASNGWPVGTTTAPYSNPSNPLTGKP